MKKYRKEEIIQETCISITCDKCKKEYDDVMEMQEFLHYVNDAGYASIFGDGNRLRLDLCQNCTKELLGPFIRIEGNYIWDRDLVSDGIEQSKMDPKHDQLNELLDKDFWAQSSFKDDKDE